MLFRRAESGDAFRPLYFQQQRKKDIMIKLEHISKTFGDTGDGVHAVKDVSLEIGDGEIFGIIGFSGAGKSTLVRCINLLERPTSGSITVNGQKLTWMEKQADGKSCMRTVSPQELRQARKKISMIFQGFNLLMQRTCLKNVCFPMELSGVPKAQAEKKALELLDLVGLKEKASAYPAQLSGGQKQRVAIARALATDPKVLLCDEATSALDPTTTNSILALLKELNQKLGVTVVIITHQMSVIEEICTRVAILDGGAKQYPAGTRAVRVSFNGGTVYDPLIASLAIDCGVKVTILGADTRTIDGKAFGTMLLLLPDDPNEAAKALSYIRSQPNITAEEVEYHA